MIMMMMMIRGAYVLM